MGEENQGGACRVLVVGGTHGNERNGVQLLERWRQAPETLGAAGLEVVLTPGNPAAIAAGRRYIDRDLNRSFVPALLADPALQELELRRARQLLAAWGPQGESPCAVALDLHSTTAAMGNSWWCMAGGRRIWPWRRDCRGAWGCRCISTRRILPSRAIWWSSGPAGW
ncbi:MAG: succinylglutamate desuccinylase/aspartoacylase family protein [Cyanobium sp.]